MKNKHIESIKKKLSGNAVEQETKTWTDPVKKHLPKVPLEDYEIAGADWKDIDGLADAFKEALSILGIYMYDDPSTEGSDWYGFILSKRKLSKDELKSIVRDLSGVDEEGEDED